MKNFILFIILGIFLIFCSISWADIPNLINFQGILDSAGNPLANKTKSVEFKIYAVPAGGTAYWSETQSVTTNAGGVFNVLLGSSNPIPDSAFEDTLRWLGIKVGTDAEMTPRQQIVSNAYGYRVATVDGATGGTIFGNTSIQSDLFVDGKVGIGVSNPGSELVVSHPIGTDGLSLMSDGGGAPSFILISEDSDGDGRPELSTDEFWRVATFGSQYGSNDRGDLHFLGHPPNGSNNIVLSLENTGKVGIGTSSPGSQPALENVRLEIADADGLNSDFALRVAGTTGSAAQNFAKSRGTLSSPSIVQSGDLLGNILFLGYDGSDFESAAWIRASVNGTPGTDDMPGRLQFLTTADGTATPSVRMTIDDAGNVGIGTNNPSEELELSGTAVVRARINSDVNAGVRLSLGNVDKWSIATLAGGNLQFFNETSLTNALYIEGGTNEIGIGTTSPQGALDVSSTTGAFIVPRMTTAQRDAITAVNGMIIYNTTTNQFNFREAGAWVTK